jgi:two-component system response regulator AdeR
VSEDQRPVVLIIEDEEGLADFYAKWLSDEYRVRTAYDGEEGLDLYDDAVDVVLLDRRMPGLSGDEVLERIREAPHDARVAMVTAITPEFDIVEMEFDEYLVKPVSNQELNETIEELLTLTTYDERIREYHALSAKRTTLKTNMSSSEITDSEEYSSLMERLADLQTELEELRDELDYTQLQHAFGVIDFEAPYPEEPRTEEG